MATVMYRSTRGDSRLVSAAEAIVSGIAADGGLYVPTELPRLTVPPAELAALSYQDLAGQIMSLFLPDFTAAELAAAVQQAYDDKFDTPLIAPLVTHGEVHFLELFHGPTLAFKDMALSILPYLLRLAAEKCGLQEEVVILTATSGDTGKAALEGFADVAGTKIIVFFPEHGVSPVQKRQMVTQTGANTHVVGIEGNFDDAQSGVKAMFTDAQLRRQLQQAGYVFSSANSINVGRLIPQIVYYYSAYLQLVNQGKLQAGQPVNFVVPTGNFGNILAAYYARQLGLPVHKLICASNANKVLFDFFTTGIYDKERPFFVTMSPSMDILVSSNLERLLYHASNEDTAWVKAQMENLGRQGHYRVPETVRAAMSDFVGGYATEEATAKAINSVYRQSGYLIDPHTAVAYAVLQDYLSVSGDTTPTVVVATASPFKFAKDVLEAVAGPQSSEDEFALLFELAAVTGQPVPAAIADLPTKPVLHRTVCKKDDMRRVAAEILQLV